MAEDAHIPAEIRDVIGHLTRFVRDLRAEGVDVPMNAGIDAARAVDTIGLADRTRAKAALQATLVSRAEDIETFQRMFPRFWERLTEDIDVTEEPGRLRFGRDRPSGIKEGPDRDGEGGGNGETKTVLRGDQEDDAEVGTMGDDPAVAPTGAPVEEGEADCGRAVRSATYSRVGSPDPIALDAFEETSGLTDAVHDLGLALGNLKGRRWRPSPGGERIDARRALRRSYGKGGTIPTIPWRTRQRAAVRAVVLVDVSRSVLDMIDRGFLLSLLQSMSAEWRNVRIFFFDTSIREVTNRFGGETVTEALEALRSAEAEWGGGTRIGHALSAIREEHPYAIDRETNVLMISDGLEADEIDILRQEMAMVSRRSNAVLWLNPLASSSGYEPTCRGMAASLPYVDGLFALSDVADVNEIARQLRIRGFGGTIGHEHDQRTRAE